MTDTAVLFVMSDSTDPNRPTGDPAPPTLPSVATDRVEKHVIDTVGVEVVPEQATKERNPGADPDGGGTSHIRSLRRIDADAGDVAQAIADEVGVDAEWLRVYTHDCAHADDDGSCGGWTAHSDAGHGTVPSDVEVPV